MQPASPTASSRNKTIWLATGAAGIALLLLAYGALTWKGFVANVGFCQQLFWDFIQCYYPMGEAVFRNGLPVECYLYSPFIAIVLGLFPLLGLDLSLVIWGILQVAAIVLYALLFFRLVPARLPIQLLFVALTLFSYPVWLNFLGGNTGMFITVALLGMLLMIERGHYVTAAVLLALAASFKFYPIIFLAPFIARRNIRFLVLAIAACLAVFVVIPSVVLGGGRTLGFYNALLNAFQESGWVTVNPHSQFFPHYVLRLIGVTGAEAPVALLILQVVSYCIAALNLIFIHRIQSSQLTRANLWSVLLVFLTVPFVLKTSWPTEFIFLPFVQAFLIRHAMEHGTEPDPYGSRLIPGRKRTLIILVLVSALLSSVVFFNLLGNFAVYGHCGFLFLAGILLLIAIYAELLPALKDSSNLANTVTGDQR